MATPATPPVANSAELDKNKQDLKTVARVLFVHIFGYGCILIAVPALTLKLYDENSANAALFNGFCNGGAAFLQFFSNSWMGLMSDRVGRKPFLLTAIVGLVIVMALCAIFQSLEGLVIATVVRGLTDDGATISSAFLGDLTPDELFSHNFAMLGAGVGLGVLLGPLLGAAVATVDQYRGPFIAGALVALLNLVYAGCAVKESLGRSKRTAEALEMKAIEKSTHARNVLRKEGEGGAARSANPFKALVILGTNSFITVMAVVMFLHLVSGAGLVSIWYLYTHERYNTDSTNSSLLLFAFGLAAVIAQALIMPCFLPESKWGETKTTYFALIMHCICLLLLALVWTDWLMTIVFVITLPGFFLIPGIRGAICREIPPGLQGQVQGALSCVSSLANIVGPPLFAGVYYGLANMSDTDSEHMVGGVMLLGLLINLIGLICLRLAFTKYESTRFTTPTGIKAHIASAKPLSNDTDGASESKTGVVDPSAVTVSIDTQAQAAAPATSNAAEAQPSPSSAAVSTTTPPNSAAPQTPVASSTLSVDTSSNGASVAAGAAIPRTEDNSPLLVNMHSD